MNDSGDLAAWIELSLVPGLGGGRFRSLLSAFGLPGHVLQATRTQLCRVVPETLAESILERKRGAEVDKALTWAEKPGHAVLTLADDAYPKRLLEIPDPPALLYVAGDARMLSSPALAIVGSRNATPQGLKNVHAGAEHGERRALALQSASVRLAVDAEREAAHDREARVAERAREGVGVLQTLRGGVSASYDRERR